jgi:hypothetical protein
VAQRVTQGHEDAIRVGIGRNMRAFVTTVTDIHESYNAGNIFNGLLLYETASVV